MKNLYVIQFFLYQNFISTIFKIFKHKINYIFYKSLKWDKNNPD